MRRMGMYRPKAMLILSLGVAASLWSLSACICPGASPRTATTPAQLPYDISPTKPIPMAEMLEYVDPTYGFHFAFPSHVDILGQSLAVQPVCWNEAVVILSNDPQAGPDDFGPDELLRVVVYVVPGGSLSLQEWAVARWSWLGAPLRPASVGGCEAFTSDPVLLGETGREAVALWVRADDRNLAVVATYVPPFADEVIGIMGSFGIDSCD